jgi:ABC-type uncharacterized transport system substrate-binding protein
VISVYKQSVSKHQAKMAGMKKPVQNFLVFLVLSFITLTAMPGTGMAHPHVFIAQHTQIVFDEKGMAGIRVRWAFDEMFSVTILEDFDLDKNKVIDDSENESIRKGAFAYIADYNYYIHVKIEGKSFEVKYITDFHAEVKNEKLIYNFFIPCHVSATAVQKNIMISPYDPEYFSAIYFPETRHLAFENADSFDVDFKTDIDRSTLIFYETVNPYALFVSFKLKA